MCCHTHTHTWFRKFDYHSSSFLHQVKEMWTTFPKPVGRRNGTCFLLLHECMPQTLATIISLVLRICTIKARREPNQREINRQFSSTRLTSRAYVLGQANNVIYESDYTNTRKQQHTTTHCTRYTIGQYQFVPHSLEPQHTDSQTHASTTTNDDTSTKLQSWMATTCIQDCESCIHRRKGIVLPRPLWASHNAQLSH